MIIFYLIAFVQGLIPDNCKWTDPDGFHFDINHLKRKDNYKVTSFSGAMSFEFNFCTYGVQCNHREVKKVEYQGLLRFNYFIINVTQQAQNLNQIYGMIVLVQIQNIKMVIYVEKPYNILFNFKFNVEKKLHLNKL
ncbi:unnamed protein product [Paramecium primaurelia]|uniref:Uncharacterized protein n=1 Tax=Paramecium primaurelia TaxID=5886 RepID=A0A8S1K4V5_PARPR|nr:unnamed protein product [Paramecium primaurelia]